VPPQGPGGRKHSFKFQAGDNIGGTLVPIDIINFRIEDLTPGGKNDGPCPDGQFSFLILKIDSLCRAEFLADLASPFGKKDAMGRVNGILQGNGLGIPHMDRFSLGKSRIIFIVDFGWTLFSTETTGNAFRHVHIARVLNHFDFKIPLFPGDAFHLGEGKKLDVEMPADLDQFG
jgi:hypothetical protein